MVAQDKLSAQVAVLGSLLIEPDLVGEALGKVREEDFTDSRCRMVFAAIRAIFTEGGTPDPQHVRDRLGSDGEWTQYLLELMELTPTAANIWAYAGLMREQARMARVHELAGALLAAGTSDEVRALTAQLNGLLTQRRGIQRMNMEEMLESSFDRHSHPHRYLTWGIDKLDQRLYADPGDLVVLGGYPSAGKTALAVSFAYHQAAEHRVGFYSLETNRYKLADRLIANLAGVELSAIKHGALSEKQWEQVAQESQRILQRDLTLIEASGMSARDIQADALAHRYEMVYIDYLQLLEPESRRVNRTEQVSGISRDLQRLAHGNGILVVALSQLSRQEKTRDESKLIEPTMSDLRESGQIEQDADAILLLYLEEPGRPDRSRRVLKVAKNKEGERGKLLLAFDGALQRFRPSVTEQSAPQPPQKPKYHQRSFAERFWEPPEEDPFPETQEV